MSHNLELEANILIQVINKKGKKILKPSVEYFPLYQTPTELTRKAIQSGNPKKEYEEWVLKDFDTEDAQEHLKKLNDFIAFHEGNVIWSSN